MPKHYKGKTGVARKKAYAEHKAGKYQSGGNVDPFSTRNPEGVPAEQMAESMENQNMASAGLPTANAMERSENYQLGGPVRPPTSPSIIPPPQYKKGGPVDVTDIVKDVEYMKKWKEASESDLPYLHRIDMAKGAVGKKYSIEEKKKRILKGKKK